MSLYKIVDLTPENNKLGRMAPSMIQNKKPTNILTTTRQAPPVPITQFNATSLDSFVNWTVEAIEYWPMSDGAKVVVNIVLAYRNTHAVLRVSTKQLDGFIDWTTEAIEYCGMGNEAKKVVAMFTAYRDKEKERQEQARQELKSYWLQ